MNTKPDGIEWGPRMRKMLDTLITWQGITQSLPQWAREMNMTRKNLYDRLRDMPLENAMTPEKDNERRAERRRIACAANRKTASNIDDSFNKFLFGRARP